MSTPYSSRRRPGYSGTRVAGRRRGDRHGHTRCQPSISGRRLRRPVRSLWRWKLGYLAAYAAYLAAKGEEITDGMEANVGKIALKEDARPS